MILMTLKCDVCRRAEPEYLCGVTVSDPAGLRQHRRQFGWVHSGLLDFCPGCAMRRARSAAVADPLPDTQREGGGE